MEINQYIKELLLLNDCVIIPQFGGFVANYKTATIENNQFFPPSKEIAFNNKLISNDGLLINYISDCERIDYYSAKQKLESFVEEALLSLERNRNVYFDGIGYLHYDSRENLLFEPQLKQNLLVEAYGLQNFSYEKLYQRQVPKPAIKAEPRQQPVPIALPQRHRVRKSVVAVPLLMALALIPIKNNKEYLSKSDLGLWEALTQGAADSDLLIDQPAVSDTLEQDQPAGVDSSRMVVPTDSNELLPQAADVPATTYHAASAVATPVAAPVSTPAAIKKEIIEEQNFPYYIIGGSFKSEANANKYIREIKEYGYKGRNLGIFRGLHRVAIKGFATMEEAQDELNVIRSKNALSDAWIQAPE